MDGASRRVWCSRRVRDGRWSKYPGGGVLTGPPCDSLRRALRPAKWRFARNSQREKEFERSRFCPWSISALGATYVVVLPPSDKAVEMAQACLASPALGGAGLRPPPAVGRRRGSGAAVGSRARCARQPGCVEPRPRHILPRKTFTTREEFGCLAVPPEIREMGTTRMVRARPSPAWLRRHPRRCSLAGP